MTQWLVAAALGAASLGADPLVVREEWRRSIFGVGIGATGTHAVDLEGDGDLEIVVAAGTEGALPATFWYVLEFDGTNYSHVFVSDQYPRTIFSLRVAQVDSDPALEILLGVGGDVHVYDGATRERQHAFASSSAETRALTTADLDGDGRLEVLFCDSTIGTNALHIRDLGTGAPVYHGPGFGCSDLAVGDVDGQPGLEIVLGMKQPPGFVLDGATRAVKWTNPWGFGDFVRLGDLGGDGRTEVVSGYGYVFDDIAIFDVARQARIGVIPVELDTDALQVVDVEGDGTLEIVYADQQHKWIHVHSGSTLALQWQVVNPAGGVGDIAIGDVDGDGRREMIWGGGYYLSDGDYLFVLDTVTHLVEWRSVDVTGPFLALSHGDVDADGVPELLSGSFWSDSGYGDGLWFVHDAVSKSLEYVSGPLTGQNWTGLWRVRNANVDSDPQQEVFVTTSYTYNGLLIAYDGLTHAEEWRTPVLPPGLTYGSMALADVDGDGSAELVASVITQHTGTPGVFVYIHDAATGALEWQSPSLVPPPTLGFPFFSYVNFMRVANVDADPHMEIVVGLLRATFSGEGAGEGLERGLVFVIDATTHQVDNLGYHHLGALDTPDRDRDGVAEIVVGTVGGALQVLSPIGQVVETIATFPTEVGGLDVVDVTGDGIDDYVIAVLNEIQVRDGATGVTVWNSGTLRSLLFNVVGIMDSLYVADVDADGRLEIVANIGTIGLRVFEVVGSPDLAISLVDAPDPVLEGSPVVYEVRVANPGAFPATAVMVTQTLPPQATFVSASPGCAHAAGVVRCEVGTLAASSSATATVTVTMASIGTAASSASVAAAESDPDLANNTATTHTTVTATVEADLSVSMTDGVFLAPPGQPLVYQLEVRNGGPWTLSSVVLVDDPPPALEGVSFTPGLGTYDPSTGAWTGLDLAPGAAATLQMSATVGAGASGFIVNTATVAPPAGAADPAPGNNTASDTDSTSAISELAHGHSREQPLVGGAAYFRLRQEARASYEIVLDAGSADIGDPRAPAQLQRMRADLVASLQTSLAVGAGPARSLRWQNVSSTAVEDQLVRVLSSGCTTDCGTDDLYRLRCYETTLAIPRFNNSGSQVTVLLLQNAGAATAAGTLWFWTGAGDLIGSHPFAALPGHGSLVLNLANVTGLAGLSGTITITHDAPHGSLVAKAVALEPASGLTFDSLANVRAR